jgi:hypothetical protein
MEKEAAAPSRGLLRLVYIMGFVLLLLFLALIGGLIWKASKRSALPLPTVELDLQLNGATVKAAVLDGGQMLVTTEQELIVVDVAKKKVILRTKAK